MNSLRLAHYLNAVDQIDEIEQIGRVTKIVGLTIESKGPMANVGDVCLIQPKSGEPIYGEVVGFRDQTLLIMPLAELTGIGPGSQVISLSHPLKVGVGPELLGRILDGLGNPMDGKGSIKLKKSYLLKVIMSNHWIANELANRYLWGLELLMEF